MVMTIDIKDSFAQKVLEFLKQFEDVRILEQENYYIDNFGDLIEVRNGEEYIVPTKEDIDAIKDKNKDFITLEELKKEFNV